MEGGLIVQLMRRRNKDSPAPAEVPTPTTAVGVGREIPPADPLTAYLVEVARPVVLDEVDLASPALDELRGEGVEVVVPLVSQGELMGAMYLGRRLSDQPYSAEDRRLLGGLATRVAPAMRVAQLVAERERETKERERIHQELQVAALIQQTLLPKDLPDIDGWRVDAFYRPARAVGGDFYDFIALEGGKIGIVVGDVTDKGVPAALVMATCRSQLRAAALDHDDPGAALAAVNEQLVPEIPPSMFVTCCYAILEPSSGRLVLANAGHNPPYVRTGDGVKEIRATGMPLGLLPGMTYETVAYTVEPDSIIVFTSDGVTEAHGTGGEMYGFGRLLGRVGRLRPGADVVTALIGDLETFTGPDAEQEDDITLVAVSRLGQAAASAAVFVTDRLVTEFSLRSEEGTERQAMALVDAAVADLGLDGRTRERLGTAVSEAVMNAIEHGSQGDPDAPVDVAVRADADRVRVTVRDRGAGPADVVPTPDIEAKLAGEQSPRGWGLFLIEKMVDDVRSTVIDGHHVLELSIDREPTGVPPAETRTDDRPR
ncbi:MAG: SpoIIE family protein phosphatase [Acidimicrobiia bacterium]